MVDLRAKIQKLIKINCQQLQKFIEMNFNPASENASAEECG